MERSSRFPNSADFITVMNVLPLKALATDIFLANYSSLFLRASCRPRETTLLGSAK
jgi:hypothetical protein